MNRSEPNTITTIFRHDNINSFIGACVDPGNLCVISEYCTRGSLRWENLTEIFSSNISFSRDILDNENFRLDQMFLASLVGDIVRGMCYLHESVFKNHGNLKTSNCLIDSRWVLKISDFGLKHFKDHEEPSRIIQQVSTLDNVLDT